MQVRPSWLIAVLSLVSLAFSACGGEEEAATEVAVRNSGEATIDVAIEEGDIELRFEGVAAGTTSSFETASFGSMTGLTVRVADVTSAIDLTEGRANIVDIGDDGRVAGVSVAVTSSSTEGGGW